MKYVVIYSLGSLRSGYAFSDYDNAVDYINECSDLLGGHMRELTKTGDDRYEMIIDNGAKVRIEIKEYADSEVRYDVSYDKNNIHIETRRFTKRHLGVKYANTVLDNLGSYSDPNEDDFGEWKLDDPDRHLSARIVMGLVIVGAREKNDYSILGLDASATKEDAKRAFRKLAIVHHPDTGGSQEKFEEIHRAYERILNGTARKGAPQRVKESFNNIDMRCFFDNLDEFQREIREKEDASMQPVYSQIRQKAAGVVVKGIIEAAIGGILTAATYNPKNGAVVIFYGIILVGVCNFFKGLYYLAFPKELLKKIKH